MRSTQLKHTSCFVAVNMQVVNTVRYKQYRILESSWCRASVAQSVVYIRQEVLWFECPFRSISVRNVDDCVDDGFMQQQQPAQQKQH